MAGDSKGRGNGGADDLSTVVREIVTMVIAYVKQETLEPLQGLGRFLLFGTLGVLVGGLGIVVLVLGILRLLQTETGSAFSGHLSFIPYVVVLVVCGAVAGAAVKAIGTPASKDRRP